MSAELREARMAMGYGNYPEAQLWATIAIAEQLSELIEIIKDKNDSSD